MKNFGLLTCLIILSSANSFSQCFEDPRDFKNQGEGYYKGELDSVIILNYSLSENGDEKLNSRTTYADIKDGLLGSYVKMEYSYGTSKTVGTFKYYDNGKVKSYTLFDAEYGTTYSKTEYFYSTDGCDSLRKSTTYDIYMSGEGTHVEFARYEIKGLTRTTYNYNEKGTHSKRIHTYNKKGQMIKEVEYLTREDQLEEDAEPWLIQTNYFDKAGNNVKIETSNADGQILDIYVNTFDDQGNMLQQVGEEFDVEKDPLKFAEELLESIDQNSNSMNNEYKYDKKGNIVEVKWKYGTAKYYRHKMVYQYHYKKD